MQPIDGNFNKIFNSEDSGDEEFPLSPLPSLMRDDAGFSPRIHSPLSLGDPLTSLTLPTLPFATPQHDYSRSYSLSGDSPSEFEKFTGVLDLGNVDSNSVTQLFSPTRTNIEDLDLRDLISPKPPPPTLPSPAPRTPLNLENLLEIDSRSSKDQLQDIINTAASVSSSKASITEVPRAPTPLAPAQSPSNKPRAAQASVSELTKSAAAVPLSSENVSKIVNMLDDLISTNQSKVQLSAIPKDKAAVPATTTKPAKPRKVRGNFQPPDSSRPIAMKPEPSKSRVRLKVHSGSSTTSRSAPSPPSNGYSNVNSSVNSNVNSSVNSPTPSHHSSSSNNTSSTLETLASSLGIVKPAPNTLLSNQTTRPVVHTLNSTPRVKKTIVKINPGNNATQQPIVIGKANTEPKSSTKVLKKPVVIAQIPTQTQTVVRSKGTVSKGPKIVSATIKTGTPVATSNKVVVPYKSPKTESKKYVLLPLEKLQNASPSVISQLGLDSALGNSNKRPASLPEKSSPDKRIKSDTIQKPGSFTENTKFPINITLPKQTKEKFSSEFTGSIPEMMEKARAKRKSNLSSMSNFAQMENFINDFIQQNNDQVMEILFLKQNNKEINRKYNQLAKLFHTKNEEHQQLKKEVEQLGVQNKKMEKELKSIKDLIKKYMS